MCKFVGFKMLTWHNIARSIKRQTLYQNCTRREEGLSVGLDMLRKEDKDLTIKNYSKSHIHATILDNTKYILWGLTGREDETCASNSRF